VVLDLIMLLELFLSEKCPFVQGMRKIEFAVMMELSTEMSSLEKYSLVIRSG